MILLETDSEDVVGGIEVRLGYLLSEHAWGKGIAGELVSGFVTWCRRQANIVSIVGGVEQNNVASQRVLEKNGFLCVQCVEEFAQAERLFRLKL